MCFKPANPGHFKAPCQHQRGCKSVSAARHKNTFFYNFNSRKTGLFMGIIGKKRLLYAAMHLTVINIISAIENVTMQQELKIEGIKLFFVRLWLPSAFCCLVLTSLCSATWEKVGKKYKICLFKSKISRFHEFSWDFFSVVNLLVPWIWGKHIQICLYRIHSFHYDLVSGLQITAS